MTARSETTRESRPASPPRARAKLFRNGRSQAVRLPKEFRLPGQEVLVYRDGPRVVLEPLTENGLPEGFRAELDRLGAEVPFPDVEPLAGALTEPLRVPGLHVEDWL